MKSNVETCLKKMDVSEILEFLEKNFETNAKSMMGRSDDTTEFGRHVEQVAFKIHEARKLWKAALTSLANSE